jgi:hypothetical protein
LIIYFEGVSWLLTVLLSSHLFIRCAFLAFRIILQHRLDRCVSFFFRAEQGGFNFFIGPPPLRETLSETLAKRFQVTQGTIAIR